MIGGSVEMGKNIWVAPGALIINKCKVEDDSLIGMGAVVIKNVEKKTIVAGNPAKFLKDI
jgi:UDP-3-O-[3-hydroxymyristoyl] glucosamine N-acyltransferase